jgi:FkbM family methyltransferase
MDLGGARVLIPVEFADQGWDLYERPAMRTFVNWIRANPDGAVLDVGCARGLYSHVALSVSKEISVIAIDADIASIASLERLTKGIPPGRLTVLSCLVGDVPTSQHMGFADCRSETRRRLDQGEGRGDPQYVCIGTALPLSVFTLDALQPNDAGKQTLLKMDIEGAELLALRGAERLLARKNVSLLLSVHSNLMVQFGHTRAMIEQFLGERGYRIELLAVDHEEHWWVSRGAAPGSAAPV